ncbi:helix-turn-helix domain-containing protein [Phyllobacterium sp. 22229]|uniref:AraC family transcriptional regulator n=1 Tax=Phyllobacterium myrsinacearum TaxID=28101 RepID=A0A2S9JQ82_9HYPH|nr:AraC family transcriptional regulator [Phyllobacterium myrsinacearum]PRD55319.1 AraC family transcriptional regulator [Phyllobacterium myrsinacearum]PWV89324.1 AraC-like DNA-binding protein [Phyllobacterium myrsinacearum]RZS79492.1 AraC-like DNA-binding protein [Phyllobacterium myrsinacearum]RZV05715.1 AraC-like DNA-binding protein [Phyllobacterium myrsinacearum]
MNPDLEVVAVGIAESFKAWEHGYPYRTVRWHFHPEYEIHHVVATTGQYFVGDFIGDFEPGNLVLTGPNLPHNWVSDVPPGTSLPLRCRVLQFSESFFSSANEAFPELSACKEMLEMSRRGALFSPRTAELVGPLLGELVDARGIDRIQLFMGILKHMSSAAGTRELASARYHPDPSGFMSSGMNKVLAYINANLTERFVEGDLADLIGQNPSSFSRSFRRHTGMALVQYVNRLRINFACHLLMSKPDMSITDICFTTGFNNISNFNRRFLEQKGMAPTRFRTLLSKNIRASEAA